MDNLVISNLLYRKTRTATTMAGVALGVVLVVLTVGIAHGFLNEQGRRNAALTTFEERFRRELGRELRIGARLNRRLAAPADDARWNRRVELLGTMPPELVFDLLQSRIPAGAMLRWLARRPGRLVRVGALTKATVARR